MHHRDAIQRGPAPFVRPLGSIVYNLPSDQRAVLHTTPLRAAPALDAPPVGVTVSRGMTVPWSDEADGFARVARIEWDADQEPWVVVAEQRGWVPAGVLGTRLVRHFYHFTLTAPAPDAWSRRTADAEALFQLYWAPLVPRPSLVTGQDEWLDAWYEHLRAGVGRA